VVMDTMIGCSGGVVSGGNQENDGVERIASRGSGNAEANYEGSTPMKR